MVISGNFCFWTVRYIASGAFLGTEVSVLRLGLLSVQNVLWNESFCSDNTVLYKNAAAAVERYYELSGTMSQVRYCTGRKFRGGFNFAFFMGG